MNREIRSTTREHSIPDGRVTLLGAYRSVTGAMTRIDHRGGSLLVDCGVAQGREREHAAAIEEAADVKALVLTHGHLDHVGRVPELFDAGFTGRVYGTRATLALAELNVRDSLAIGGASERELHAFVQRFQERAQPLRYDAPCRAGGLALTLREAGHILGSASVELETAASRVVLSGDLGRPHTPLLRDAFTAWPRGRDVDLVVLESTYGNREHACTHAEAAKKLAEIVEHAVRERGHVLIPAFAIGRTQTILYLLNELVEDGVIPPVPVAVDTPLGLRVTELYRHTWKLFDAGALGRIAAGDDPLDFEDLYAVRRGGDSRRLREMPGPMIIIAGSGMCTGGRIVEHLIDLLPLPQTTVLLVGYQAAGTPGGAIQHARPGDSVKLAGLRVPVGARVATLSGLSAHADRLELAAWLDAVPNPRAVALHHGEPEAQQALATWLSNSQPG